MKAILPLLAALSLLFGLAIAAPVELKLKDGTILKGEVAPAKPGEIRTDVVVTTDYGVSRIPIEKLTDEAKVKIGLGKPLTATEYEAHIKSLQARIKSLEEENARLRREMAGSGTAPARPAALTPTPSAPRATPADPPEQPSAGGAHSISSTGKRHNSRCRYYGSGKPCGATDGVACKICGG